VDVPDVVCAAAFDSAPVKPSGFSEDPGVLFSDTAEELISGSAEGAFAGDCIEDVTGAEPSADCPGA
jgi:hypothetical protein